MSSAGSSVCFGAGALLATTDTWDDKVLTEEPSRALRYFPPPAGIAGLPSTVELFEDNGLQTGDAPDGHVVHRFWASADAISLRVRTAQSGHWPLPYRQIRVVLPAGEQRRLDLASDGIALVQ